MRIRAEVYVWVIPDDITALKIGVPWWSKRRYAAGDAPRRLSSDSRSGR